MNISINSYNNNSDKSCNHVSFGMDISHVKQTLRSFTKGLPLAVTDQFENSLNVLAQRKDGILITPKSEILREKPTLTKMTFFAEMQDNPAIEVFSRDIESDKVSCDTSWRLYEDVLETLKKVTPESLKTKIS